jgi:class 3 adenylate cyclase/predicted ATPase
MANIKRWLEGLRLGQYAESFAANNIDFNVLPDLTEAELEALGLSLGDRKRLRRAIDSLTSDIDQALPSTIAPPITEPYGERRQITVMFCDLVGSSEMLDAEDFYNALHVYRNACVQVIRRFEGFIAEYIGDGILAYFGYPVTHEGEAERAVRAGLAVLRSIPQMASEAKTGLEARIGIATGIVVIGYELGPGATAHVAITGKTPNLAARIKEIAQPGSMVIAETTQRLVAAQFEHEFLGEQRFKGISKPVHAWRVVRELSDVEKIATKRTKLLDCVGRDRELRSLLDHWQLAAAGNGQAIVISGEAGIGKTRLARLLREQLPVHGRFHIGLQCAQQYCNSPLQPVITHLRRVSGLQGDDPPTLKRAKIERLLAMAGRSDGAPLIATLLYVPFDDGYVSPAKSPAKQRAKTLELLIEQIFGLAAQKPVLLVVEDAHWLDPSTEEMLIHLLDRLDQYKIMILMTIRPDYSSHLVNHPRVIRLTLGRLGIEHAKKMISAVSGDTKLPLEVVEHILIKTDGVPLFIEELTKDVLESGQLQFSEATNQSIPSTLSDTLRARIDRLSSDKEVIQVGAAIGRTFPYLIIKAVLSLENEGLDMALDRLAAAKLIYQHGVPPNAVYTFKHMLVRDVAYDSMLRSQRIALHTRIVAVIEKQFPDIAENEPELVALHCSRPELGEKAVRYWLKAAGSAVSRSANVEAIHHIRNGMQWLHAIATEDERARLELELQLTLGQALIAARGYTAVETTAAFARAEQLVDKIGDTGQRYSALYGIFVGYLIGGNIDAASEAIGRMRRLASSSDDDAYLCLTHRLVGSLCFFRGDLDVAVSELQKSIALYGPAQKRLESHFGPDTGSAALIFLAMTEWLRGRPESAQRTAQNAISHARKLENTLSLGQVLTLAAQLQYMSQDCESMLRLSKEGDYNCRQNDIRYFGAICELYRIWAQAWLSSQPNYIEDFRRGLAAYEEMKCGLQVSLFRVMLAQLLLGAGEPAEAAKESEAALVKIAANGERWWAPEVYRLLGHAVLALPNPDVVEAEKCFRRSIAEARHTGALMLKLRATTSLAQLLTQRGDREEAQQTLASVLGQFTEGFDSRDFQAAMEYLSEKTADEIVRAWR